MHPSEFRVFLSSTFLDLQAEREQLVKKVFPRIRAKCRERGVEFTEIDLRWGITDEEARSGRSVRICLDEIGRSPYFIGILGDRYGWIPSIDDLTKDEECLEQYPWLENALGKSITEFEFMHGAFQPERLASSLIYARLSTASVDSEEEKLERLKLKARDRGLPLTTFTSPEDFGELVFNDLSALLDRDWPLQKIESPVERERAAHDAYALNRTHSYVADAEYVERFHAFVESGGAPLVVWGKSGLGKSALVAHITDDYRERAANASVIRHFVGAAADATRAEDVIRHVMLEIADHYKLPDEVPQDDSQLQQDFPAWLAKVPPESTLVIAIDAVNQLSGIGPEMHWLPEFIPANIRLVISTTPEPPLEQLRARGYQEMEVRALDAKQRESITTSFLTRYRKSLTSDQLRAIAEAGAAESPLFLRTLLEEIRVFGRHSALEASLRSYLASSDENDLFQRVLERMESDFGENVVRSVMTSIWASRHGLSETELLEITQLNRLQLSAFLIALEFHLMQRGGLYTFFHQYLRSAVEARYLAEEESRQRAHRHIADYVATREFSDRRRDEEPWQWRESGNLERLKDCMMRPEMVALFEDDRLVYEAYGYWRLLPSIPFDESYIRELAASGTPGDFTSFRAILKLLTTAGLFEQAAQLADTGMQLFQPVVSAEALLELSVTRAELELHRNNFERAIELSLAFIRDHTFETREEQILRTRVDGVLSVAYYQVGRYSEAEEVTRVSLVLVKTVFGDNSAETAVSYKNLGAILIGQAEYSKSEEFCRTATSLFGSILGLAHPETVRCRINLALALGFQARFDEALTELRAAHVILMRSLGPTHALTLNTQLQIAEILARSGDTAGARTSALELCQRIGALDGSHNTELSRYKLFIAYTYYLERDYVNALPHYEENISILAALRGENHPDILRYKARREEILEKLRAQHNSELA